MSPFAGDNGLPGIDPADVKVTVVDTNREPTVTGTRPTIEQVIRTFEGRQLDNKGLIIQDMNASLAHWGYASRVRGLRRLESGGHMIVWDDIAPQEPEAAATVPHERGPQPMDGGDHGESRPSFLMGEGAAEGEPVLDKFARVWEGDSNSGTEQIKGV